MHSVFNREARRKFAKFSAPLFHLTGMDVIIVDVRREGERESNDIFASRVTMKVKLRR